MADLLADLQTVFRRVFDEDDLVITETTSAADVNGWDSMAHINLIVAIEKKFGVRFTASEIASLGGAGQNVGNMAKLLAAKVGGGGKAGQPG
jgi:acyl carrier protein